MAAVVSQFQLWMAVNFGICLMFLLTAGPSGSSANLAIVLGILALLQPWFFGLGAWFVRYRSIGSLIAAVMLAMYVAMVPVGVYAAPGPLSQWRFLAFPIAGVIAIFGVLLTIDAYRRWLTADID